MKDDKGFVHVFDEVTLDLVLQTLDTITDFVDYLEAKEELLDRGQLGMAAGEEELLALYLSDVDERGRHGFLLSSAEGDQPDRVIVAEGHWDHFARHPQRRAQLAENEVSYVWDSLIEQFNRHLLGGTQEFATHAHVWEQEESLRLLAREPRTRRRSLAQALLGIIQGTPPGMRATRVFGPLSEGDRFGDCAYVFLVMDRQPAWTQEQYRTVRRDLLGAYCQVVKLDFPEARDIVGIATGTSSSTEPSEDFAHLHILDWPPDEEARVRELRDELERNRLLGPRRRFSVAELEYPHVDPA
jgi:hypothetical protein